MSTSTLTHLLNYEVQDVIENAYVCSSCHHAPLGSLRLSKLHNRYDVGQSTTQPACQPANHSSMTEQLRRHLLPDLGTHRTREKNSTTTRYVFFFFSFFIVFNRLCTAKLGLQNERGYILWSKVSGTLHHFTLQYITFLSNITSM